jgi:DedD protein
MSPSPESPSADFNPKHRIVGAIVLVSLAIIFFPMILDQGQGDGDANSAVVEDPARDKRIFVSKVTPVAPAKDESATASSGQAVAPDSKPAATLKAAPAAKKATSAKSNKAPVKKEVKQPSKPRVVKKQVASRAPSAKTTSSNRWVVRIGLFSRPENVTKIMKVLRDKGFKPKSGKVDSSAGVLTRVWVGPFQSKQEAAKVRRRIRKQTGEEGLIVSQ